CRQARSSRRCGPARSMRANSPVRGWIRRWVSTRQPSTTTTPASTSRERRFRSWSTRSCGTAYTERSVIETAAAAENALSYADFRANDAIALQQIANDPTIEIRKLDDSILEALGEMSGEVLYETSRKDDLTRWVYDSFIKFRTSALRWGDVSERAFLNARALPYQFGG